jgi:hypothetical protein
MINEGDCGAIGGMKIGRGNQVLGENLPQHHFVHHKYIAVTSVMNNVGPIPQDVKAVRDSLFVKGIHS